MNTAPDHPVTVKWVLFGFRGRIGRKSFALAALLMLLVQAAVFAQIIGTPENSPVIALWGLLALVVFAGSAWVLFALAIKRLHDLGLPGALALCILIPALAWIAFLLLAVIPSNPETNQHGPPPFPKA